MTKYLAGVLTVIAVGVLLVAYGLLSPRASAFTANQEAWTPATSPSIAVPPAYFETARATRLAQVVAAEPAHGPVAAVRPAAVSESPRPRRTVAEAPKRNWKKTAMVVGGSAAGGAGVGALIGGKKGALVGAAIGGGAGTLYEVLKK